jgi:hypothetical protein
MSQMVQEPVFVQDPVFQDQGNVLDDQYGTIAGDAEGNFREHGVDIGMPVSEPCPKRLTNIKNQNHHGTRITKEPDDDREIDDVFELVNAQDIPQKPGEKGPGTQRDDRQINGDPQTESEVIVQTGRTQSLRKDDKGAVEPPTKEDAHKCQPEQEPAN